MPCHTLSVKYFSLLLRAFSERAFVSLDFRRKYLKAFPFMKKISNKTSAGKWDFCERGWCYAVMFISFCLLNKFVFSVGPSSNGIIQMNLARFRRLESFKVQSQSDPRTQNLCINLLLLCQVNSSLSDFHWKNSAHLRCNKRCCLNISEAIKLEHFNDWATFVTEDVRPAR